MIVEFWIVRVSIILNTVKNPDTVIYIVAYYINIGAKLCI